MKTLGHKVSETQTKEIMKLIDENGKIYIDKNVTCTLLIDAVDFVRQRRD